MPRKGKSVFSKNPRLLTCALCPATFLENHSQHKYCDECREKGKKLKNREWWEKNREKQLAYLRERAPLYYQQHKERINAKIRTYQMSEAGKKTRRRIDARQRERNPQKIAARQMVRCAIVCGTLVRKICERCSNPQTEAHHDDYSKPLEVRWLCHGCHRIRHQELGDGGFGYARKHTDGLDYRSHSNSRPMEPVFTEPTQSRDEQAI